MGKNKIIPIILLLVSFAKPSFAEENDVLIALKVARQENLTPYETRLLLAIRAAENGGKGKEYGVLSVKAKTQEEQARVTARSIKANKKRWIDAGKPGDFVDFMGKRWAPIGAKNDAKGLNKNWARNVKAFLATME